MEDGLRNAQTIHKSLLKPLAADTRLPTIAVTSTKLFGRINPRRTSYTLPYYPKGKPKNAG